MRNLTHDQNNQIIFTPKIRETFFNFQKKALETSYHWLCVCTDLIKTQKM